MLHIYKWMLEINLNYIGKQHVNLNLDLGLKSFGHVQENWSHVPTL